MKDKTTAGIITRALAEKTPARMLRAFIDGMSARKDVRVREKKIGGPAPAALVRANRGQLPDDLLDFFAEMNGATFRFTLIPDDTPIDGFEIDPLVELTQFGEREEIVQDGRGSGIYLNDFGGPGVLSLLFDNIQNERPVHFIRTRNAPPKSAKLVYSPRVDRPPRVTVAKSVAEYVRLGISRAFAVDWPRNAAGTKIAARLDVPPRAPTELGPGARVISKRPQCCSPNFRATVVQVDTATRIPAQLTGRGGSWKFDNELVLLTFDQGPTCYVPRDSVSLIKKKADLYESARQDPAAFLERLRAASPPDAALMLARIGVSGSHQPMRGNLSVPDTAPRLCALLQLAPRPLVADVLVDSLETWLADLSLLNWGRKWKADGTEYEKPRSNEVTLGEAASLAAGALALWCWWLTNEQDVKSLKAELPKNALARLGKLAVRMERHYQVRGSAKFLALAAKGRLPPYPPQEKTGWLVFGAKPKTKFSLHPWGFLPASFFGVKSKHPVYWT